MLLPMDTVFGPSCNAARCLREVMLSSSSIMLIEDDDEDDDDCMSSLPWILPNDDTSEILTAMFMLFVVI